MSVLSRFDSLTQASMAVGTTAAKPLHQLRRRVQHVTDRIRNPFGIAPDSERFVPGYGDANADFHVIGDRPSVHGGVSTGVPFTGTDTARQLLEALKDAGLLRTTGDEPAVERTFLSYLHMCVSDGQPTDAAYRDQERNFDAELRAIAAHVLLPVGERATRHVLKNCTARSATGLEMDRLHGQELLGSGWLVLPIADPANWSDGDDERLVDSLLELQSTDFRRETDLGRFLTGGEPYHVR